MDEIPITTTGATTAAAGQVSGTQAAAVPVLAAVAGAAAGVAALLGLVGTPDPVSFTTLRGGLSTCSAAGSTAMTRFSAVPETAALIPSPC